MSKVFTQHINHLQNRYETAMSLQAGVEGILIHSGVEQLYFADDQAKPFRAYGHFNHWLPVNRPDQLLLVLPGQRPVYFQVVPPDFWYDQTIANANWWAEGFDIVSLRDIDEVKSHLPNAHNLAYLGEATQFAVEIGVPSRQINTSGLCNYLDYFRAYKTAYEIQQIRAASENAGKGHLAAFHCFQEGGSEYDINLAYLTACGMLETECPYPSIVALDEKAAILHYQNKRRAHGGSSSPDATQKSSQVLLIDAGSRVNGYCSDITRTWTTSDCHPVFRDLVAGVDSVEQQLVARVRAGASYIELHREALSRLTELAVKLELIRCSAEQALDCGLPQLFMPHGVGHLLGIQVHDVGGHLASPDGGQAPPPEDYPFLRNTRIMTDGMVFTVEPGFYFIPMLLEPERDSDRGRQLNWPLIDTLMPLGGVRIEDNVLVVADGVVNLTRESLGAHFP